MLKAIKEKALIFRYEIAFTLLVSLLTIVFNFQILRNVILYDSMTIPIDDGVVTEFLTETEYKSLSHFNNPFATTTKVLYPFETNFAFQDTSFINVPFLFVLRPLLDIHQATQLIVLFNIALGNLVMYLLLRRFKLSNFASMIGALIYGFSPYLSYRVLGHLTYTATYFFPLLMLIGHSILNNNSNRQRVLFSIFWGAVWAGLYYANPYYFITAVIGSLLLFVCSLVYFKKRAIGTMVANLGLVPISILSFLVFLLPWILSANEYLMRNRLPELKGIVRPLTLSSDLMNLLFPSEFNPLYNYIFDTISNKNSLLAKLSVFFEGNWGRFGYPGILILVSFVIYFFARKKIPSITKQYMKVFAVSGIIFAILSLGPLLKVFNKWYIILPEEIPIYFPLPFLALHFIPFFDIISAPSRFITGTVFFGSIFAAFIFQFISDHLKKEKLLKFFILVLLIFIVDQTYFVPNRAPAELPVETYQYINNHQTGGTVLEVPFVLRDGLQYMGDVHAQQIMRGAMIHEHPIIGGYLSRIDSAIFDYYRALPFIGHIGKIIDKGNFHLYKEPAKTPSVSQFLASNEMLLEEIELLDINYVIVKNDELYSQIIQEKLIELGFKSVMEDGSHSLYFRRSKDLEFTNISFGDKESALFAGRNFSAPERGFRWGLGKSSTVFIKTNKASSQDINFEAASFHLPQEISIYLNDVFLDGIDVETKRKQYTIKTKGNLNSGLNRIDFVYSKSFKPSIVLTNNLDNRDLAMQFYSLTLE